MGPRVPATTGRRAALALAAGLVGACGMLLPARARAAEPDAIAVMPVEIRGNVQAGRAALEAAIARAAAVAERPVVGAEEAAARLEAAGAASVCEAAACWTAAGRAVGASQLLAGEVERKEGFFHARFRLVEAASGRIVATESNQCDEDDCSVAELCRVTARELLRQTLARPPGAGPGPSLAPATAAGGAGAEKDRGAPGVRTWRALWPPAAIAVGVAAIGGGAFLVKLDGDCADRGCNDLHNTLWGGVATLGAGAALTAAGVAFALRDARPATPAGPSVAVGPGGIVVSGRF
jgi:hypothetical protein